MSKMNNALNRAFEKAFAHTATRETLLDLLACLGEELSCDRIAIFEINHDDTCDNTHEWCAGNVHTEQELLQSVPMRRFGSWWGRLKQDEVIWVREISAIAEADQEVYDLFSAQHVHSVVVARLAFHGKSLGFFVLENPNPEMFDDTEVILPGMRYILSSLVYSDHLVRRLEHIGFTDRLTGAGNRQSLQEHIQMLEGEKSLGVIYCSVIGWLRADSHPEHLQPDQMLLQAGNILTEIYGEEAVFRVATDEFIILQSGMEEEAFQRDLDVLSRLFREHDLLIAVASVFRENGKEGAESLIRQAHLLVLNERKHLEEHQETVNSLLAQEEGKEHCDKAEINLPQGDEFFRRADQFLSQVFDQPILTAVIDLNYFKLYNDIFGRKAGSRLLEEIAESLEEEAIRQNGIAGYLGGDNFCLMIPAPMTESEKLKLFIEGIFADLRYTDGFAPAMGIYISYDRQEMMVTMYDRALTALGEIKGSYMEHYRFYDAEHFQHQKDDKILLMDIREGLAKGEICFYIQPQVQERTGKIIGGEALVRWKRGDELVSPGRFIPVLEKTGYIFPVDCYVWEAVAKWLRSLLDRGIQPVPVSVNVSRVDFYFVDIAEHFINLLKKYDLSPALMGVEITESAFTDNTESILAAVTTLRDAGFRILMDDFGSGSSSLSMLHSMQLDVLKTDVRFMSRKTADVRAVSIVESVISMAHMIGMMVVTEGVETEEQRDNLIAMGDNYAQGFYFYRPMPVEDFEALLSVPENIGIAPQRGDRILTNHIGFRNMIREGMVSDTLLDNIIGPAAVYREEDGVFHLVQMNDQYRMLTGVSMENPESVRRLEEHFHQGEESDIRAIIRAADRHPLDGAEGALFFTQPNGERHKMDVRIFLLYSLDNQKLYLSTINERKCPLV